jgi:hypothetical protein
MQQARVQEAQNTVKFQSLQAAQLQTNLAASKIQLENLPTDIKMQRDAAGVDMMSKLQNLGFTPALVTADTPQAHRAGLEHMNTTQGAVPALAYITIGGQQIGFDLSNPNGGNQYQLVRSMSPFMALPPMSAAEFNKLPPEKKIDLASQAISFWQPAGSATDIKNQIENYKSLKATYMQNNPDDTATAKKFDNTIAGLQQTQGHFQDQDINLKYLMDVAEQKAKINAAMSDTSENSIASQLVEGTLDPSQLSKRGQDYTALLKSANQYSLSKYGKPFDAAQAQADYKFASTPATQNTLKYLNSLTGNDNVSGNLGTLVTLSNNITRTKFPSLNDASAWARLQAGDPQMAQYHTAVTEVADQVAKILQGGGSGTSDAKLKQASDLFRLGYNKDQLVATATTLRDLLANRKLELIGNNRYLQRQYNVTPATVGGNKSTNTAPNTGATHTYNPATGTVSPIQGGK